MKSETALRRNLEEYRLHADLCRVLTDPKRLMLLDALRDDELSVGELADSIGTTLPNASQHLAVLRSAGLVEARRSGTTIRYRIAEPAIVRASDIVHDIVAGRLASVSRASAVSAERDQRR